MQAHKRIALLAYTVAALLLASCSGDHPASESHDDSHAVHWDYEADDGPANWGTMEDVWRACAEGREQSPIQRQQPFTA